MELVAKKYKQTDVGIIPIDWDLKRLLDVSDFSNGKAHEQSIDEAGDFVVVNSKFISTEGEIFKNSNQAISPLAKGDITLVMSDIPNGKALAKCYLIEIDNKYTLNQRICSIETRVCDNVFLFYVLNRNKYFLSFDSGSGQTNLRRNEVLDCPLAIPPTIAEQTAIATALTNIDELISQTEKLIDKKKAIKQGVMQELLKPKEGWVTKKLGEVATCYAGGTPSTFKREYWGGNIAWLPSGRVKNNIIKKSDNEITITELGLHCSAAKLINPNSILIAITGATCGNIGLLTFSAAANQSVVAVETNTKIDNKLIYYILLSMRDDILRLQTGSAQGGVNLKAVKSIEITIPENFQEQIAISQIIFDFDINIENQMKKLNKLKHQKQGMMQALLTGKIRLL